MKYLLLIHNTAAGDASLESHLGEPGDRDQAHARLCAELSASGELLDTSALEYDRTLVRGGADGPRAVTDGPFTEAREIVGGYYLVDVASLDRAVEIAGRFVESRFAPVEIRALA
ncbi:hypothetical protein GCM10025867_44110 [Frondihabitans sucicola]|uniref:YCII-related domain-containing protein n=1 Tax=Frondihabitans sucicola TaxID=1268041 RepID=A0ABM8GUM2_9MICO|nr:YciI family protein [Frondihabitans sucicola]BDZ52170.1 hypothetical protein GCM10025867_44110 [Frondihabitans sucicola]